MTSKTSSTSYLNTSVVLVSTEFSLKNTKGVKTANEHLVIILTIGELGADVGM